MAKTSTILLTEALTPPPALVRAGLETLPAIIRNRGERASRRFIEFFTVSTKSGDLFQHRKQLWLRLHEKGGKGTKFPVIPSWRAISPLGPKLQEWAATRRQHYSGASAKASG